MNDEQAMRSWERWYTTPPDDEEEVCECGERAEYIIHNEPFCECCIDRFRYTPHNEVRCSICDELMDDGFLLDGEPWCESCFEDSFRI